MPPAMPPTGFPVIPPGSQEVEDFCHAANRGDVETVRNFLDQFGASIIDRRDNINARAITWAAFSGHLDVVELLVARGADINAGGTNEKPALTWAIDSGRGDVAQFLLKKGASLDIKDDSGLTPVDYAKRRSDTDMLALIDARLLELKEYERLNGEEAKAAAAREAAQQHLGNLKRHNPPPKLKF